jgi:GAF domain-containing protein
MESLKDTSHDSITDQLALLHRVSRIVNSNVTLKSMLDDLVSMMIDVTGCDACLIYLLEPLAGEVVLCASQLPHTREIGKVRLKVGEGVTGWVAQHRAVVALSSRASSDPRFKTFASFPEDKFEAFLSVPLTTAGEVLGVINIHHKKPRNHTPNDIALLSYVAEQMAGAIAKASLYDRSRAATRKVETLAAVGDTIAEEVTEGYLDRILQVISEMVAETFDSPVCSIMIVDTDKQELSIKAARCSSPEYLQKHAIKIDNSLIGRVVSERKLVAVSDVAAEKLYRYPELARKSGLTSLLSVPLIAGPRVIGTLNIYTRERRIFSEDQIGFAKAVAGQIALALENARLMSETLEMKQLLEARKVIERAKGILQQRHALSEEEAYFDLRRESRRLRKPMRELAEAIVMSDKLYRVMSKNSIPVSDSRKAMH